MVDQTSIPIVDILTWVGGGLGTILGGLILHSLTVGKKQLNTKLDQLDKDIGKVCSEVKVLKEVKIDETKARQIVAESIDPIKHGQEEIRSDIKEMISTVNNLAIQLAREEVSRSNHENR